MPDLSEEAETDEVVALIVSVAIARAATWIPFADGAERALLKIEAALPRLHTYYTGFAGW